MDNIITDTYIQIKVQQFHVATIILVLAQAHPNYKLEGARNLISVLCMV